MSRPRDVEMRDRDQPMEIHGDRHGGRIWGGTSHEMGNSYAIVGRPWFPISRLLYTTGMLGI